MIYYKKSARVIKAVISFFGRIFSAMSNNLFISFGLRE